MGPFSLTNLVEDTNRRRRFDQTVWETVWREAKPRSEQREDQKQTLSLFLQSSLSDQSKKKAPLWGLFL